MKYLCAIHVREAIELKTLGLLPDARRATRDVGLDLGNAVLLWQRRRRTCKLLLLLPHVPAALYRPKHSHCRVEQAMNLI